MTSYFTFITVIVMGHLRDFLGRQDNLEVERQTHTHTHRERKRGNEPAFVVVLAFLMYENSPTGGSLVRESFADHVDFSPSVRSGGALPQATRDAAEAAYCRGSLGRGACLPPFEAKQRRAGGAGGRTGGDGTE